MISPKRTATDANPLFKPGVMTVSMSLCRKTVATVEETAERMMQMTTAMNRAL